MFKQGPVPAFVHGIVEYAAGVLLIVAPFLFGFDSDAATAAAIVIGVLVLIIAASTAMSTGLIKSIPVQAHVMLDYIVAIALIAAPFVLGFSDDGNATAFFITLGIVHLLLTIATRFIRDERPRRPRPPREGPAGSTP
jgi:SPW repeat